MEKVHKINLLVIDLEDAGDVENIINRFNDCLNGIADNCIVKPISWSSKDFVFTDECPFNVSDISKELKDYYDNLDNDEYQTYLKLKKKYDK